MLMLVELIAVCEIVPCLFEIEYIFIISVFGETQITTIYGSLVFICFIWTII